MNIDNTIKNVFKKSNFRLKPATAPLQFQWKNMSVPQKIINRITLPNFDWQGELKNKKPFYPDKFDCSPKIGFKDSRFNKVEEFEDRFEYIDPEGKRIVKYKLNPHDRKFKDLLPSVDDIAYVVDQNFPRRSTFGYDKPTKFFLSSLTKYWLEDAEDRWKSDVEYLRKRNITEDEARASHGRRTWIFNRRDALNFANRESKKDIKQGVIGRHSDPRTWSDEDKKTERIYIFPRTFSEDEKYIRGLSETMQHERGHGLHGVIGWEHGLKKYNKQFPSEKAITYYGRTNMMEDFAETYARLSNAMPLKDTIRGETGDLYERDPETFMQLTKEDLGETQEIRLSKDRELRKLQDYLEQRKNYKERVQFIEEHVGPKILYPWPSGRELEEAESSPKALVALELSNKFRQGEDVERDVQVLNNIEKDTDCDGTPDVVDCNINDPEHHGGRMRIKINSNNPLKYEWERFEEDEEQYKNIKYKNQHKEVDIDLFNEIISQAEYDEE